MTPLQEHEQGVVLRIKAQPGARADEIKGVHAGHLKVSVTQAPEKGKANKAILAFLAKQLGLRPVQLELLSGETQTQKRVLIREVTLTELAGRLERFLK
ncbi:MAG: DUF167 domain-containing protein [Pirellulaceae bacterium]